MADEAIKEVAAAREKHRGTRLASGEFFYLVERIDKLDEKMSNKIDTKIQDLDVKLTNRIDGLDSKLTGRIDGLDSKLTGRIDGLDSKLTGKFDTLQQWMIGLLVAVIVGAGAIVIALLHP